MNAPGRPSHRATDQASAAGGHGLLPYRSTAEFLDGAVPFLREGVRAGDAVLVVSDAAGLRRIQEALGSDGRPIEYADARAWYLHPARTTEACVSFIREQNDGGRAVRILGEPVWGGRSVLERAEWERVEALINVICAETDATFVCAYDQRATGLEVLEQAVLTHPEIITSAGRRPSPLYVGPGRFNSICDQGTLAPHPESAVCVPVPSTDLHLIRAFVAEEARAHGLPDREVYRLLSALTEVATNAVRHGTPPVMLRIWTDTWDPGLFVCEVSDAGFWRPPDHLGLLPPEPPLKGDFGLWAVRMLCSSVQIRAGVSGTTVRLYSQSATKS